MKNTVRHRMFIFLTLPGNDNRLQRPTQIRLSTCIVLQNYFPINGSMCSQHLRDGEMIALTFFLSAVILSSSTFFHVFRCVLPCHAMPFVHYHATYSLFCFSVV